MRCSGQKKPLAFYTRLILAQRKCDVARCRRTGGKKKRTMGTRIREETKKQGVYIQWREREMR